MKKFSLIILPFLLIFTQISVLANLQEDYEKNKTAPNNTPIDEYILILEDAKTYENSGNSIYGLIINTYQNADTSIDRQYMNTVKNNYSNFLNTGIINKIEIEDSDYVKISEETKKCIAFNNYIFNNEQATQEFISKVQRDNINDKTNETTNKKEKGVKLLKIISGLSDDNYNNILQNIEYNHQQQEITQTLEREKMEQVSFNTSLMLLNDDTTIHYNDEDLTTEQIRAKIKQTIQQADLMYSKYSTNKNNMKDNLNLIKLYGTSNGFYKNASSQFKEKIDNAYDFYIKSYYSLQKRYNLNNIQNATITKEDWETKVFDYPVMQIYRKLIKTEKLFEDQAYEVSYYSYNYEETKYNNWAKRNNKKQICGSLANYVYMPYTPSPQIGCLYTYYPQKDFTLRTLQTVPGGILLHGSYSIGYGTTNNTIFIQTSKKYTDNQAILEPLIVEYKGITDYMTILGARKRIYQFYRYGKNEINNNFNIPGQPFYFYNSIK